MTTSGKLSPIPENSGSSAAALSQAIIAASISVSAASLRSAAVSSFTHSASWGRPSAITQARMSLMSRSIGSVMPSAVGLAAGFQSYSFTARSLPSSDTASFMSVPPTSIPQYAPRAQPSTAARSLSPSCPTAFAAVLFSSDMAAMSPVFISNGALPVPRQSRAATFSTFLSPGTLPNAAMHSSTRAANSVSSVSKYAVSSLPLQQERTLKIRAVR